MNCSDGSADKRYLLTAHLSINRCMRAGNKKILYGTGELPHRNLILFHIINDDFYDSKMISNRNGPTPPPLVDFSTLQVGSINKPRHYFAWV
jgi:hypothetical protein